MQPYGQPPPGYSQQPMQQQQGYGQPAAYGQQQGYGMPGTPNAWREGVLVVTNAGSIMIPHCLKCGQTKADVVPRMKDFEYVPAWANVFYIFGRLGRFIINALAKRATLAVALCNECESRWKAAKWIQMGAIIGGIVMLIIFSVGLGQVLPELAGIFFGLFFIAWIVSLIMIPFLVVRPRTLTAKLIEGPLVKLEGAHGSAIAGLPGQ
ncbi:hypothetical protein BH09MYX1_BH09MYX1_48850 [soil metagenome]